MGRTVRDADAKQLKLSISTELLFLLKTFDDEDFHFASAAMETVDRSYGWGIDDVHHNITDGHVVHHLFFTKIPHYNLKKATVALRPYLEALGVYRCDVRVVAFRPYRVPTALATVFYRAGDVLLHKFWPPCGNRQRALVHGKMAKCSPLCHLAWAVAVSCHTSSHIKSFAASSFSVRRYFKGFDYADACF